MTMATVPFTVPDEDVPVDTSALQGISLAEFLALPEVKPALEYEAGEVTQKVAPQGEHSALQGDLVTLLNQAARPGRIARAFPELRFTHGGRSYVPDVAVYLWERVPKTATGAVANRFTEPPDIAIEIASPEQRVTGLIRKCVWLIEQGVRVALVVDPDDRTVMVFRPQAQPRALRGTDAIDLTDIIPDIRLSVAELFGSLQME
jgi:Uma2 family endonuclease